MTSQRPLIACATYRKFVEQKSPIEVYGLMPAYTEAVFAAGGLPLLIPLGLDEEALQNVLERVDGLLLPGGGDVAPGYYNGDTADGSVREVDEARDRSELMLVQQALEIGKPLLAICRGHQVFNVALGGTLWEDLLQGMPGSQPHDCGQNGREFLAHTVQLEPESRLARILGAGEVQVNSLHHQGIRALAPPLRPVGAAPDGLIEAVELREHPFAVGVQWHPENLIHVVPSMLNLFRELVLAADAAR